MTKALTPSEHAHQVTLVNWFDKTYLDYSGQLFAIPNGGLRAKAVAVKLAKEGVRRGVPDLMLPVARGGYHGLFIELKKEKGRVTSEQKQWINILNDNGYLAVVCMGHEAAIGIITDYMSDTNWLTQ